MLNLTYLSNKILIEKIAKVLKDYRSHEQNTLVRIQPFHVKDWIKQFDQEDRRTILLEMEHIFRKRYFSRSRAKKFLYNLIIQLTANFKHKTPRAFLKNCQFLDLQPSEKSQTALLELLDEVLLVKFNMKRKECGSKSRQYSIYLDDMLCTGLTLIRDLTNWAGKQYSEDKSNKEAVTDGSTIVVLCYFFLHNTNYHKKMKAVRKLFIPFRKDSVVTFRALEIENDNTSTSKNEILFPKKNKHKSIQRYKKKVNEQVDEYLSGKTFTTDEKFFRAETFPGKEVFFTTARRRHRIEEKFLIKGIDILNESNVIKPNIRPLGFSLPSVRNFGFGTLCFTWRNIANNTPLVFWYSSGNFVPLFKKKEYHP